MSIIVVLFKEYRLQWTTLSLSRPTAKSNQAISSSHFPPPFPSPDFSRSQFPRPPLDDFVLVLPPRILFSSLRVWFSFRKDHALQLECGNYIFIVSVAKLSSKNVDSRPGPHLTWMAAALRQRRLVEGLGG